MFKFAVVLFAVLACAAGKPHLIGAPLAVSAPAAVVAAPAPVVTATSSQVVARNYNGIATAPVLAPVAAPVVAKTVAPVAFPARYASAYSVPLTLNSPYTAHYGAALAAPVSYSSPLAYATAGAPVFYGKNWPHFNVV